MDRKLLLDVCVWITGSATSWTDGGIIMLALFIFVYLYFCSFSSAAGETCEPHVLVEEHERSHVQVGTWGSGGDLHQDQIHSEVQAEVSASNVQTHTHTD